MVIPDLWRLNLEWREKLGHSLKARIEMKQEQRQRRREADGERKSSLHMVKPSPCETKDNHVHDDDNSNKAQAIEQLFSDEIGLVTPLIQERLAALIEQYPDLTRWEVAFDGVVRSNVRRLDYLAVCLENVNKPKPRSRPR